MDVNFGLGLPESRLEMDQFPQKTGASLKRSFMGVLNLSAIYCFLLKHAGSVSLRSPRSSHRFQFIWDSALTAGGDLLRRRAPGGKEAMNRRLRLGIPLGTTHRNPLDTSWLMVSPNKNRFAQLAQTGFCPSTAEVCSTCSTWGLIPRRG